MSEYLNGPLIPGDVIGPKSREMIQKIMDARDAKLLTSGEFAGLITLNAEILSWGRFWGQSNLKRIAALLRCTVNWASKLLVKGARLGLVGWAGVRGHGSRSFLGLAPELMPLSNERVSEYSNPLVTEYTEHNMNNLTTGERERADLTSLPASSGTSDESSSSSSDDVRTTRTSSGQDQGPDGLDVPPADGWIQGHGPSEVLAVETDELVDDPAVGTTESLTPAETHEEDSRFAADRLAQHLFHGLPDPWTCRLMYRRFLKVATGMTTQVLAQALLGTPARTIDNPGAYAVAWIANAEERSKYALAV